MLLGDGRFNLKVRDGESCSGSLTLKLGSRGEDLVNGGGEGPVKQIEEGPAVACFRLPTLLYAVGKATRFILRDGRCSMGVCLLEFMVVCELRYCQVAQA
jgi:hypothetical protein